MPMALTMTTRGTTGSRGAHSPTHARDDGRRGGRTFATRAQIASGYAPAVCVRHQEPPVERVAVTFVGRPSLWLVALLVAALYVPYVAHLGMLATFLALALVALAGIMTRRALTAPAWPMCDQCLHARRRATIGMWAFVALDAAGWVAFFLLPVETSLVAGDIGGWLLLVLLFVLPACAVLAGISGSHRALTGGHVTQDDRLSLPASVVLVAPAPAPEPAE
jgi:hypothetical protein